MAEAGELQVGDLVTTYHSGYRKIVKVEPRPGQNDSVYYDYVCSFDGKTKPKQPRNGCDAGYCHKVDIEAVLQKKRDEIEALGAALTAALEA